MSRPRHSRCAPFELPPWALGLPEALALGGLGGVGLGISLGPKWGFGLLWGIGTIALGRWIFWEYSLAMRGVKRPGPTFGLMGLARILLYGSLAFTGISLGLAPLAICGGLLLPGIVLKIRLLGGLGC